MADFTIEGGGTVYLIRPLSDEARDWLEEHVEIPDYMRLGGAVACEHSYVGPIVEGMLGEGLVLEDGEG